MANASSSTVAVAALMQKASQQYLECRRRVTAKSDEVSKLDSEIQSLFERITVSSTSTARGAKSVGRLELSIVAVEGDAPVDDAVITVEIDPEYEEPEAPVVETKAEEEKTTEEVEQAEAQEETEAAQEEAAETAEEATEEEVEKAEEAAETEAEKTEEATEEEAEKTEEATEEEAEKIEETTEEQAEKTEEAAVVEEEKPVAQRRSVAWSDADSLPLSLVFDPVQSREAVVTISIAAPAEDGEESEPVKEFRIPVSSLFQTGSVNRWYVIKKVEHIHTDKAAITEVADEDEPTPVAADAEEPVKEEKEEECSGEAAAEKPEETETPAATEEESAADATEKVVEPKTEEEEEPKTEETVAAAPHQTLVEATATVQSEDTVVVLKEGKLHVQVHFTMSEIEKLSQTAIALSQQKQEAEATLAALEREAASLRTKYERLSASQRSMSTGAGGVVKPRSTLLGGRGLGGTAGMAAAPRVEKSSFQKIKDSVAATLTPQRTQVLTSFAIFVGSVALFHFQGDNLLA